jgi:hypothetical protein
MPIEKTTHAATSPLLEAFLSHFSTVKQKGSAWAVLCPAHADQHPSLEVTVKPSGKLVFVCRAGCSQSAVWAALQSVYGFTNADISPTKATCQKAKLVKIYDYKDLDGTLLYQSCRYEPKAFKQRRPDGKGGSIWNMTPFKGKHVPYRLPDLKGRDRVVICEGEKDCDRLWNLGIPATTNIGGAKKWTAHDSKCLKAAGVSRAVVIPDNDKAGFDHIEIVRTSVMHAGLAVAVLVLPGLVMEGGDVSDWLNAGHTKAELLSLIEALDDMALAGPTPVGAPVEAPADIPPPELASPPGSSSQATTIVTLADGAGAEYFHDGEQPYLRVPVETHHEIYRLKSRQSRAWLNGLFMDAQQKCAGSQAMQDALNALEAKALRGADHRVHVRLAWTPEAIYLDLGDASWQVVEVRATGWCVVPAPVRFRRPKALLPLPVPTVGASITEALHPFVNTTKSDFVLLVMVLVMMLRGRGPYPILAIYGEQGSAKSTLARIIKALIDPNMAPIRSEPREPRDLMIAATNNHVQAFDNLSHLSPWLSDCLCRLATGGGFSTRMLYENDEEQIFDAMRPVVINGIVEVARRPDLLSRAVALTLPRLTDQQYRDEETFWADFEGKRPAILGALLTLVATALAKKTTVQLTQKTRMADFAMWAVAAEAGCPWKPGTFLKAYTDNREEAVITVLTDDAVAEFVRTLVTPQTPTWTGTATVLLDLLNNQTTEVKRRRSDWPKTPRQVADALRRLAPALRQIDINADLGHRAGKQGHRQIILTRLEKKGISTSASSAASAGPANQTILADAPVDADQPHSLSSAAPTAESASLSSASSSASSSAEFINQDGPADETDETDAENPLCSSGLLEVDPTSCPVCGRESCEMTRQLVGRSSRQARPCLFRQRITRGEETTMTKRTSHGVAVVCGRQAQAGRTVPCVGCGQPFAVPPVAFAVWSGDEVLGVFGPCCLNACCRAVLIEKTLELEQAGACGGGS